jgi:hypothetical protein
MERDDSNDGKLTVVERDDADRSRRTAELVQLQTEIDQVRLPHVREQLDSARDQLQSGIAQAGEQVDEHAAATLAGLDELQGAISQVQQDVSERMQGVDAAFSALDDHVGKSSELAETASEQAHALCALLLGGDEHCNLDLLGHLASAEQGQRQRDGVADKQIELHEAEHIRHCAEAAAQATTVGAAVVEAMNTVGLAVVSVGLGGPGAISAMSSSSSAVAAVISITDVGGNFSELLAIGDGIAEGIRPLLPHIEPVTDLVHQVDDLLNALNPFD